MSVKVEKKEWQSSIELRIHFKKEYWYKLCGQHLKALDPKKFGWTEQLIPSIGGCDIPWCGKKMAHEVYPTKKCIVSFWKMKELAK